MLNKGASYFIITDGILQQGHSSGTENCPELRSRTRVANYLSLTLCNSAWSISALANNKSDEETGLDIIIIDSTHIFLFNYVAININ